eukprot:GHVH01015242.1.p1 GENE.GHVH01015242.1~~GHVH01015242.1.p1  ORF type:complete len:123 (+),score=17.82 GHVH01015242.1:407-775(+)
MQLEQVRIKCDNVIGCNEAMYKITKKEDCGCDLIMNEDEATTTAIDRKLDDARNAMTSDDNDVDADPVGFKNDYRTNPDEPKDAAIIKEETESALLTFVEDGIKKVATQYKDDNAITFCRTI